MTGFSNGRSGGASGSARPQLADILAAEYDPQTAMAAVMCQPEHRDRIFLGVADGGFHLSEPEANVGIPGAQRQGKTMGFVPGFNSHVGPAVGVVSKRYEFLRAVTVPRARVAGEEGEVFLLDLSGEPAPPGVTLVGHSPISTTKYRAYSQADALTTAIRMDKGVSDGSFWTKAAKRMLGPVFLAAGVAGKDTAWVLYVINNQAWEDTADILDACDVAGAKSAAVALRGLKKMAKNTRASIWTTAVTAMEPYELVASERVTKLPPMDYDRLERV